jgi:hypothetical protein
MESLALCSKILYDRDILEKQKEIIELKKKYYCSHGKLTLHIHQLYNYDFRYDEYSDPDPNMLLNRCTALINNIHKSIFKLFNYIDEPPYQTDRDFIKENFKKILNNDCDFENKLTEIIYDNLSKFTESPLSSKEKTNEIVNTIFEIFPIIYDHYSYRFTDNIEKLIKLIRFKIFGVYEEEDLCYFDNDAELIEELTNNFEIICYCDECKKVISPSKIFYNYQVCNDCFNEFKLVISKYKKRKKSIHSLYDEVEKIVVNA